MGHEIEEVKAVEARKATQPAAAPNAAPARPAGGELDAGKSTVKGQTDYFDGKSVITDADTVVDIATIMSDKKASNMKPETLAAALREKGYEVEVVKMGNRKAVKFKNGDYFVDSDGDGNLGTKDQNFQNALGMVEKNFGVNLTALKESKYTAYHKYSEIGKDGTTASDVTGSNRVDAVNNLMPMNGINRLNAGEEGGEKLGEISGSDIGKVLSQLDGEMAARGYKGDMKASDLWQEGKLSPILQQLGISQPSLPEPGEFAVQKGLNLFGAAFAVAVMRENAL